MAAASVLFHVLGNPAPCLRFSTASGELQVPPRPAPPALRRASRCVVRTVARQPAPSPAAQARRSKLVDGRGVSIVLPLNAPRVLTAAEAASVRPVLLAALGTEQHVDSVQEASPLPSLEQHSIILCMNTHAAQSRPHIASPHLRTLRTKCTRTHARAAPGPQPPLSFTDP